MGRAEEMLDSPDFGIEDFLKVAVEHDALGGEAEKGIARQAIDRGIDSLTPRQRAVLDERLATFDRACSDCADQISWQDMGDAAVALEDGLCPTCRTVRDRD